MAAAAPKRTSEHERRSVLRRIRASKAAASSTEYVEAVASNYAVVASFETKKTASNADAPYFVLIGAELNVDHVGEEKPIEVKCEPYKGAPVVFKHVSPRTLLGPPFRCAVACTCYDWQLRSGFRAVSPPRVLQERSRFRDAGAGCKHMMLCNADVLQDLYVTLGPSVRDEQKLAEFYGSQTTPPEAWCYQISKVADDPSDQLQPEMLF